MVLLNSYFLALRANLGLWQASVAEGIQPAPGGVALHDGLQALARIYREGSEALSLWRARARQRRYLRELSPHLLRDIGISRGEALREARKPCWRG